MVLLGSWASGFFIIATNAWMQHPVGYPLGADGTARSSPAIWALLFNAWVVLAVPPHHERRGDHRLASSMAGLGAFYLLSRRQHGVRPDVPAASA